MLAKRNALPDGERMLHSRQIHALLLGQDFYKKAQNIFCYASVGSEVDTYGLMEETLASKKLFLPRVSGEEMHFHQVDALARLQKGFMGILEPTEAQITLPGPGDIMLVPAVAYNPRGYRIGYGKGFYDKYFSAYVGEYLKIGLCFAAQLCDFEEEAFDRKVNLILTERGVKSLG